MHYIDAFLIGNSQRVPSCKTIRVAGNFWHRPVTGFRSICARCRASPVTSAVSRPVIRYAR